MKRKKNLTVRIAIQIRKLKKRKSLERLVRQARKKMMMMLIRNMTNQSLSI